MWRSLFLVLQASRLIAGNFTNKWTHSKVFFNTEHGPPMLPQILPEGPPPLHQILKSPPPPCPPCSQHLWETLLLKDLGIKTKNKYII